MGREGIRACPRPLERTRRQGLPLGEGHRQTHRTPAREHPVHGTAVVLRPTSGKSLCRSGRIDLVHAPTTFPVCDGLQFYDGVDHTERTRQSLTELVEWVKAVEKAWRVQHGCCCWEGRHRGLLYSNEPREGIGNQAQQREECQDSENKKADGGFNTVEDDLDDA